MKNLMIAITIAAALSTVAVEVPKEIEQLAVSYKTALEERSMEPLEGKLADDFDFAGAGPGVSRSVLEQILGMGVLSLGEISEIEVEYSGDTARVYIHAPLKAGGAEQDAVDSFDAILVKGQWKITAMGKGALQPMIIQDPTEDLEFELEGPAYSTIEFDPDFDHIIVELELSGGDKGNFIVDNGAPLTIISASHADRFEPLGDMAITEAKGVGGDIENSGAVIVDYLGIGEIEVRNLSAITMDLSHLSAALGVEITGLLGTEFLARFAWTLDYSGHKLILSRIDDEGKPLNPEDPILSRDPAEIIGFERTMHLIQTVAEFGGGVVGNIVLDSGAGAGLATPELFEKIPVDSYEPGEGDTLMGADRTKKAVESFIPEKLTIGPESRDDYRLAVSDLSHINQMGLPIKIDAIIGYNFFRDWLITTRYDFNTIELRPIPK